jgi:hypothetical protein
MKRGLLTSKQKGLKRQTTPLVGGPLAGEVVKLFDMSTTLFITVRGQTGRYVYGRWEKA